MTNNRLLHYQKFQNSGNNKQIFYKVKNSIKLCRDKIFNQKRLMRNLFWIVQKIGLEVDRKN